MLFVDRQVAGPAVDLPRAREHDLDVAVVAAARFENVELRRRIDVQIGERIGHRVEMARLPGEIEKEIPPLHQPRHRVRVANVGDIDRDLVPDIVNVEGVASIFRDQAVDERHPGAQPYEAPRQGGADKPESTRNQDVAAGKDFDTGGHIGVYRQYREFL
jgi:hypothetical protein